MADLRTSDILAADWARRAREILAQADRRPEPKKPAELWRGGTFKTEPVEKKKDNALNAFLRDPKLNRGLANIGEALVGEGTGSLTGDLLVGLMGGGAGLATELAGGKSGAIDWIPGGSPAKAVLLGTLLKNPRSKLFREAIARGAEHTELPALSKAAVDLNNTAFNDMIERYAESKGITKSDAISEYVRTTGKNPESYLKDDYAHATGNSKFGEFPELDRRYAEVTEDTYHIPADYALERFAEFLDVDELKKGLQAYDKAIAMDKERKALQNFDTFKNNPKAAAQEIVDAGLDIDSYLGERLSEIRPGQRKAVEEQLRKLGVDIPEEVVVKEKKAKKEAAPKPVQLPKSEQQRIAARETALKTFKREPNKVYKSIEKGRDPADYFKGEVPEEFEQGYRDYLAAKSVRKEAEAAAARQAKIDAENARQNAVKTEKQLEREQADAAARDEIARAREEAEAARAAKQAAYDDRRPDAVLAAGWKPEEHPLYAVQGGTKPNSYETIGGKTYPLTDREKRDLFVADSLAGEVLKSLDIKDAFKNADSREVAADPNFYRHNENYTNYEKLWPHYKDKLDEARELGLFSDDVMTTKKKVRNKDGSMRDIDVDYLQLSHPQLPIMEGIYGMPDKESTLSLYDLMFRRRLDDELKAANPGYVRQLNVGEPGSRAYRVLNALKKR